MNSVNSKDDQRPPAPEVVDATADRTFNDKAFELGLNPNSLWVGRYVEYEWHHLRPLLEAYEVQVSGRRVLEFGSNVGASAVVLAFLGAKVDAVDVAEGLAQLTIYNGARYGVPIRSHKVVDTRSLPFNTGTFDLVNCNSVLEYVPHHELAAVQREINRILRPGGLIVVTGTSSRLWPREVHTKRWLVNYLPRVFDRSFCGGQTLARGVWPWEIRNGFGDGYRNIDAHSRGRAFLQARKLMQPRADTLAHHAIAHFASALQVGPGLLMNNISCLLQKPR